MNVFSIIHSYFLIKFFRIKHEFSQREKWIHRFFRVKYLPFVLIEYESLRVPFKQEIGLKKKWLRKKLFEKN